MRFQSSWVSGIWEIFKWNSSWVWTGGDGFNDVISFLLSSYLNFSGNFKAKVEIYEIILYIFHFNKKNKLDWNLNKSQTNVTLTSHLIPKSSLLSETRWSTWCTALVECSNYMVVPFLMQDLNAAGQAYMHLVDCKDVKLLPFPAPPPKVVVPVWANPGS